jgi:hypothetical protein
MDDVQESLKINGLHVIDNDDPVPTLGLTGEKLSSLIRLTQEAIAMNGEDLTLDLY